MPALTLAAGTEFDKGKIVPYSYRHTYAQRHADAGIAPDVLRDLMNHRNINATPPVLPDRGRPPPRRS